MLRLSARAYCRAADRCHRNLYDALAHKNERFGQRIPILHSLLHWPVFLQARKEHRDYEWKVPQKLLGSRVLEPRLFAVIAGLHGVDVTKGNATKRKKEAKKEAKREEKITKREENEATKEKETKTEQKQAKRKETKTQESKSSMSHDRIELKGQKEIQGIEQTEINHIEDALRSQQTQDRLRQSTHKLHQDYHIQVLDQESNMTELQSCSSLTPYIEALSSAKLTKPTSIYEPLHAIDALFKKSSYTADDLTAWISSFEAKTVTEACEHLANHSRIPLCVVVDVVRRTPRCAEELDLQWDMWAQYLPNIANTYLHKEAQIKQALDNLVYYCVKYLPRKVPRVLETSLHYFGKRMLSLDYINQMIWEVARFHFLGGRPHEYVKTLEVLMKYLREIQEKDNNKGSVGRKRDETAKRVIERKSGYSDKEYAYAREGERREHEKGNMKGKEKEKEPVIVGREHGVHKREILGSDIHNILEREMNHILERKINHVLERDSIVLERERGKGTKNLLNLDNFQKVNLNALYQLKSLDYVHTHQPPKQNSSPSKALTLRAYMGIVITLKDNEQLQQLMENVERRFFDGKHALSNMDYVAYNVAKIMLSNSPESLLINFNNLQQYAGSLLVWVALLRKLDEFGLLSEDRLFKVCEMICAAHTDAISPTVVKLALKPFVGLTKLDDILQKLPQAVVRKLLDVILPVYLSMVYANYKGRSVREVWQVWDKENVNAKEGNGSQTPRLSRSHSLSYKGFESPLAYARHLYTTSSRKTSALIGAMLQGEAIADPQGVYALYQRELKQQNPTEACLAALIRASTKATSSGSVITWGNLYAPQVAIHEFKKHVCEDLVILNRTWQSYIRMLHRFEYTHELAGLIRWWEELRFKPSKRTLLELLDSLPVEHSRRYIQHFGGLNNDWDWPSKEEFGGNR